MKLLSFLAAVGLVTCSQTVPLKEKARTVEFVNQTYIGHHGSKCTDVGSYQVEAIPAEIAGDDRLTVLEIKAKNEALKHDATHLLLWPAREWQCDKDGTENPRSERTCAHQEVTAYACLIGRGT